jgi:hypothetical protein
MSNQLVEITGSLIGVWLKFQNKGTLGSPTDHPVLALSGLLNLPPSVVTMLQTTLSATMDQVWAANKDANGQTMLNRTQALIRKKIASGAQKFGSGYSAYNVSVNLPTTGNLLAAVASQPGLQVPGASQIVTLSYQINGVSANFAVTTPFTGGLLSDPIYNLTLDITVLIQIILPNSPGLITATGSFGVGNASINASNVIAGLAEGILSLVGEQANIFQPTEGRIDAVAGPADLGPLTGLLAELSAAWTQQGVSNGFTQLSASIDFQLINLPPSLNFRFIHPLDPAPVVVDAAVPQYPSLFPPLLGTSASVVQTGSQLGVSGSNFPVGQASALYIAWTDTTSGAVTESDINWGPASGPPMPQVNVPRNGAVDGKNTYSFPNLIPNQLYAFSVRDQDLITETPFSQPFKIFTQQTNLLEILIGNQMIGSATLTGSGVFSTTVTIPANLAPGIYRLDASLVGKILASVSIQVIAATQPLPLQIEVIDKNTHRVLDSVEETYTYTLRGQGFFNVGTVSLFIDAYGGQSLGATPSDSMGRFQVDFTWPTGFIGNHKIIAEERIRGLNRQASVSVLGTALPR